MQKDLDNKIEELVGKLGCPKGFTCCTEGLEGLCKAREVGLAIESALKKIPSSAHSQCLLVVCTIANAPCVSTSLRN